MKIGVYGGDSGGAAAKSIKKILDIEGISAIVLSKPRVLDLLVVPGGDRGVRGFFHRHPGSETPVLGIGEAESGGFLAQIDIREIPAYVDRLRRQDYTIENVPRIGITIDGKRTYPVLNDIAVFAARSATLMEHTLRVNGAEVWHDSSDGVIVSTPIGSSAYSMSAGGPVIFQESSVFGIISVNSLDVTRRPMIVPSRSEIEIEEISSQFHCEAVLDGGDRYTVRETVRCTEYDSPAAIVRMERDPTAISALAKKVHLAEDLLRMPPSSKLLLKTLEYEGAMTQKELAAKTLLPGRTVRLALRHLLDGGYVKRKVSVRDARQKIYEIQRME